MSMTNNNKIYIDPIIKLNSQNGRVTVSKRAKVIIRIIKKTVK